MFLRVCFALWFAVLTVAGLPAGAARAEGTIDPYGNVINVKVAGRPDPYTPNVWFMRLDVSATNVYGQPIVGAQVTFERDCRLGVPCPYKRVPEPIGVTDSTGRLTYAWTEPKVPTNSQHFVEGAVHVNIPPDWVSVEVFYSVGNSGAGNAPGQSERSTGDG